MQPRGTGLARDLTAKHVGDLVGVQNHARRERRSWRGNNEDRARAVIIAHSDMCTYKYICIDMSININMYIIVYTNIYLCVYINIFIKIYVYYICIYVHIYIQKKIYKHIHIYIYHI